MVTIITDVRVPADQFPLGRIFRQYPDVGIEVQRIVPTTDEIIPLFWVESESRDAVETTLREDPLVDAIDRLIAAGGRVLYAVDWSPDVDSLVRLLVENNVDVLSAEGTADAWAFRLQFRDWTDLKRFRRACVDGNVDLELVELYNPMMPNEGGPLTPERKDALATAYENGYWDVPRQTTLAELADLVGVSQAVLSRRLREGVKDVVGELVFGPGGKPSE